VTEVAHQSLSDGREAAIFERIEAFRRRKPRGTRIVDMLVGDPLPRIC
jgi:hypothetical protein